jgi:hypothetical protein
MIDTQMMEKLVDAKAIAVEVLGISKTANRCESNRGPP